jgi:hypothetical protein
MPLALTEDFNQTDVEQTHPPTMDPLALLAEAAASSLPVGPSSIQTGQTNSNINHTKPTYHPYTSNNFKHINTFIDFSVHP